MHLFVAADGPREDREGEAERCQRARAVIKQVDWECEVSTLFRGSNLGCKTAVSSAIDWFFQNVEEGIILEDDCLPHLSFFPFCAELLERYRCDERIMMVSGNNFQLGRKRGPYSYYFSNYCHGWGWASWRRAWRYYDVQMELWPTLRETPFLQLLWLDEAAANHWRDVFDGVYAGCIDTWDYQWFFACWTRRALAILPNSNLVSNIGFGTDATHTTASVSSVADLPVMEMRFPLKHPPYIVRDLEADRYTFNAIFAPKRSPEQTRRSPPARKTVLSILPRSLRKSFSRLRRAVKGVTSSVCSAERHQP
jgi:hypothetical protein